MAELKEQLAKIDDTKLDEFIFGDGGGEEEEDEFAASEAEKSPPKFQASRPEAKVADGRAPAREDEDSNYAKAQEDC